MQISLACISCYSYEFFLQEKTKAQEEAERHKKELQKVSEQRHRLNSDLKRVEEEKSDLSERLQQMESHRDLLLDKVRPCSLVPAKPLSLATKWSWFTA